MPFIKAKNGNVVEVDDLNLAHRALADGHEVFKSDPRGRGKPKPWDAENDSDDVADDSDSE